jgi:hypothetical protein
VTSRILLLAGSPKTRLRDGSDPRDDGRELDELERWVNPMTALTQAERGLLTGGPVATPAIRSLLWALGIFVVFAPLAVRAYRRRT